MKFATTVVGAVLLAATSTTNAFVPLGNKQQNAVGSRQRSTFSALQVTPKDLTDMMAKAHEEKIRAMKAIEDQKNAEIQVCCWTVVA